jgi:hypothetical protein
MSKTDGQTNTGLIVAAAIGAVGAIGAAIISRAPAAPETPPTPTSAPTAIVLTAPPTSELTIDPTHTATAVVVLTSTPNPAPTPAPISQDTATPAAPKTQTLVLQSLTSATEALGVYRLTVRVDLDGKIRNESVFGPVRVEHVRASNHEQAMVMDGELLTKLVGASVLESQRVKKMGMYALANGSYIYLESALVASTCIPDENAATSLNDASTALAPNKLFNEFIKLDEIAVRLVGETNINGQTALHYELTPEALEKLAGLDVNQRLAAAEIWVEKTAGYIVRFIATGNGIYPDFLGNETFTGNIALQIDVADAGNATVKLPSECQ